MNIDEIYNKKHFPDIVFTSRFKYFVFTEFDTIFKDSFLASLKNFLLYKNLLSLKVVNLDPAGFYFNTKISTNLLPEEFLKQVNNTSSRQDYISDDISFYMVTNKSLIYTDGSPVYGIYLDREYELAIIALLDKIDEDYFSLYKICDLKEHFSMCFADQAPAVEFMQKVNRYFSN